MKERTSGDTIRATIAGDISGQVSVGNYNTMTQTINKAKPEVTEAEVAELRHMFTDLKVRIAAEAPPEKREAALGWLGELEEAVNASEPDLSTMEYVRHWFGKHLPKLAGAVTGVVVHPIVGKLVEAAGDALAAEFHRRFGASTAPAAGSKQ